MTHQPRARKGASMELVHACYDGAKTTQEIALELNFSSAYVRATINRLGLPIVRPKGLSRRAEYFAAAAAGMTHEEAAAHLGVTHAGVRSMATAHGITFRSKLQHSAPPKPIKVAPVKISASPEAIRRYLEMAK